MAKYFEVAPLEVKNSHTQIKKPPIRFPAGAEFVHNVPVAR
jgi:hypothetical protein